MFTVSRRSGRRMGVRSGGARLARLPPMLGLTGFTASNYAETANPGGIAGDAGGFWGAALFSVLAQVTNVQRAIVSRLNNGGAQGWEIRTMNSNTTMNILAYSGSSSAIASPAFTIPAAYVGKEMLALGVHTGTHLRLYVDALEVGAGTPIVGFRAATTNMRMGGRSITGIPATDVTIYGEAGGIGAPTLAQIQQYFADVKAARAMVPMTGVSTQGIWNVTDTVTVRDSVGTDHMAVVGTPTLTTKQTPDWSW